MNIVAFREFLSLINTCYQLDDETLSKIETMYQAMYQDLPRFQTLLVDELGYEPEDAEYVVKEPEEAFAKEWDIDASAHKSYLVHLVLAGFFPCYFDDWKFYCEDLSDYISQYTDTPFVITSEEYADDIDKLCHKLESQTPFSMIHIWSGGDDVHFWLIDKTHKSAILALTQQFDIWID